MDWMDYALLTLVALALFLAVRHSHRKKAAGNACGCGGCAGCAVSKDCPSATKHK
jgi:hypothetical protein